MLLPRAINEAIVGKIKDVIKNSAASLPCKLKDVDLSHKEFKINVDAKIHLEIDSVSCDFEIHYPEEPQVSCR